MKANELMTGDIVRIKETGKVILITIVDASYETVCYFDVDAEGELTIEIRKIEPIPLTEELLIKNGWHKYYFGAKDISDKVSINYELKNDYTLFLSHYLDEDCFCSAFGLKRIEFRYVHELQHALRLCRIEKTIEI